MKAWTNTVANALSRAASSSPSSSLPKRPLASKAQEAVILDTAPKPPPPHELKVEEPCGRLPLLPDCPTAGAAGTAEAVAGGCPLFGLGLSGR